MSQFPWSVTKTQKCDWERAKQAVTLLSTISQSKVLSTMFSRKIHWQGYCSNYDRKISRGSHVKARPGDPREISQRAARCPSVLLPQTRPASPPSWLSKRLASGWASLCKDHLHGKLLLSHQDVAQTTRRVLHSPRQCNLTSFLCDCLISVCLCSQTIND